MNPTHETEEEHAPLATERDPGFIKEGRRLRPEVRATLEQVENVVRDSLSTSADYGSFLATLAGAYNAVKLNQLADELLSETLKWASSGDRRYPSELLAVLLRTGRKAEAEYLARRWLIDKNSYTDYVFGRGHRQCSGGMFLQTTTPGRWPFYVGGQPWRVAKTSRGVARRN